MKKNYVNMHANYFYMRDDYVDMQVTNRFKESYFHLAKMAYQCRTLASQRQGATLLYD